MCCQFNVPSNTSSLWTTRQDVRPKPRSATNLNRLHKQKSDYVVVYILNAMRVASDDTCDYGQQISKPMAWLGISQTRMSWLLPRLGTCANRRNLQNHSHANDASDLQIVHTYTHICFSALAKIRADPTCTQSPQTPDNLPVDTSSLSSNVAQITYVLSVQRSVEHISLEIHMRNVCIV